MKPIDLMRFGPSRAETKNTDGTWLVTVTPHAWANSKPSSVTLSVSQYDRYLQWLDGSALIQDALPDLSDSDREILLTGLDDEEFHAACGDDEEG